MKEADIISLISEYKSLSIIGMEKNTGKTTTLNHIISDVKSEMLPLGLTSIGRDGEETDVVTATDKPRIYVKRGTLIATARKCLYQGDITREILAATGIGTPLGEVIIARALSDGYVELAGPSINAELRKIIKMLQAFGCSLVIADGALSRKTTAVPTVAESTILCTGAAVSKDMKEVIEKTRHTVEILSIEREGNKEVLSSIQYIPQNCRIAILNKDMSVKMLPCRTSLEASKLIIDNMNEDTAYIYIKGIITDGLFQDIMKSRSDCTGVTIMVEDGTKLFVKSDTIKRFRHKGGNLHAVETINLICITCNPTSPYGYEFQREQFLEKMREEIPTIPVVEL